MQSTQNQNGTAENRHFESGNYSFALGLMEAQCGLFAFYPGTPISEIYDHLKEMNTNANDPILLDNAINETVAFSEALGASWSGIRAAVAFKHLGMNLISDVLHSAMYSGIDGKRAGLVIICGGDPECTSSTNSQDNRLYSLHTKLPILEPWDVDSCRYLISVAFELSESVDLPVMVYTNSRLCHSSGLIYPNKEYAFFKLQKKYDSKKTQKIFIKNPDKYRNAIHWAIQNQKKLNSTIDTIANTYSNQLVRILNAEGSVRWKSFNIVFITSGICTSYIEEFCRVIDHRFPILSLILTYPFPSQQIRNFISEYTPKTIIICEELESYIEEKVKIALYQFNIQPEIIGKEFFPKEREFKFEYLYELFKNRFSLAPIDDLEISEDILRITKSLPIREPTFCPGCAHRNTFYALRKAADEYQKDFSIEIIFGGDIGCYTLGMSYPYNVIDWLICMGAGVGISNGVSRVIDQTKQHLVALIGDSTYFHSGIQPIINLVKNKVDMTILILDNFTTAMTGHQPSISTPQHINPESESRITIKEILKSLQIDNIIELDGYTIKDMQKEFLKAFRTKGLNIVLVSAECALNKSRRIKKLEGTDKQKKFLQISDSCQKCNECYEMLGCTAIQSIDNKYKIIEERCVSDFCDSCYQICPNHSIYRTFLNVHKQDKKNNQGKLKKE